MNDAELIRWIQETPEKVDREDLKRAINFLLLQNHAMREALQLLENAYPVDQRKGYAWESASAILRLTEKRNGVCVFCRQPQHPGIICQAHKDAEA